MKRSRLNPYNQKRRERRFELYYKDEEYLAYVKSRPCIVPGCARPSQFAHTQGKNIGATWRDGFPCCWYHHNGSDVSQHVMGMQTFMEYHAVDPFAKAAELAAAYEGLDDQSDLW